MKSVNKLRPDLVNIRKMDTSAFGDHIHKDYNRMISDRKLNTVQRWAKHTLLLPSFDYFVGLVIVVNLFVMVIETDRTVDEEIPPLLWTSVFGWAVLVIFGFEVSMKIIVYGFTFWKDPWSVVDFLIILTDATFSLIGIIAGNTFPISVLRIFRLVKLARVSKVLRSFPELRLLMAGLVSAVSTIFWGSFLLLLFLLVWSIVAVLFIHPLNKHIDYGEDCLRCSRAYSSVANSTLTFWQSIVVGDGWADLTVPLLEKHPSTLLFFLPLFLSVGMAVMNLILGVIVSVAEEAKAGLLDEDKTEKALEKLEKETELLQVCAEMDSDRSGGLNHDELLACFDQPSEFRDILEALEIGKEDFDIVWNLLDADARTGEVSFKDLISHLCTIRISDSHFMLAYIKHYINNLKTSVHEMLHGMEEDVICTRHAVEEEVQKIEQSDRRFGDSETTKSVEGNGGINCLQDLDQLANERASLPSKTHCSAPDYTLADEEKIEFPEQCAFDVYPKLKASKLTSFKQIEEALSAALTVLRECIQEEFAATEPGLESEQSCAVTGLPHNSELSTAQMDFSEDRRRLGPKPFDILQMDKGTRSANDRNRVESFYRHRRLQSGISRGATSQKSNGSDRYRKQAIVSL